MCDEAKSQLQIHGSFGNTPGTVTIEDTTLDIVSWSDSLIICNLPDSGKGAGGNVIVKTLSGLSKSSVLSIVNINITNHYWTQQSKGFWTLYDIDIWKCNWRADLSSIANSSPFPFEISKSSKGSESRNSINMAWMDSSELKDSTMSVSGTIDPINSIFYLRLIYFGHSDYVNNINLAPKIIGYDIFGTIKPTTEDTLPGSPYGIYVVDYSGSMTFPPATRNNVALQSKVDSLIIFSDMLKVIKIISLSPLGSTTASLYSIDGRLLKHEKINIDTPGNYTFDASGITPQFGILVLQTPKGVITKKIIFLDLR